MEAWGLVVRLAIFSPIHLLSLNCRLSKLCGNKKASQKGCFGKLTKMSKSWNMISFQIASFLPQVVFLYSHCHEWYMDLMKRSWGVSSYQEPWCRPPRKYDPPVVRMICYLSYTQSSFCVCCTLFKYFRKGFGCYMMGRVRIWYGELRL